MFQIRQFSALPIQYQGDNISRKASRPLWFLFGGCYGVRGLTGHPEAGKGRVKEFNLLRDTVLRNREILRFQISDGFSLLVFDDHVNTDQV